MKKLLLLGLALLSVVTLTGCENVKMVGNKMNTGSYTYYYAYVVSNITGPKYYHIDGWAEYGPEGGGSSSSSSWFEPYVGLELHLYTTKDVVYYYEQGLSYILSKQYNPEFGTAIE